MNGAEPREHTAMAERAQPTDERSGARRARADRDRAALLPSASK